MMTTSMNTAMGINFDVYCSVSVPISITYVSYVYARYYNSDPDHVDKFAHTTMSLVKTFTTPTGLLVDIIRPMDSHTCQTMSLQDITHNLDV